jgi:hypothetical protein
MALSNDFFIKKIKINNSYASVSFIGEVDGFFYWGTRSSVSSNAMILIKTNSNLDLISVKSYTNGEVGVGYLKSMVRTANGDRLVLGYYDNINPEASDKYCIIKLNSNDDIIWFKTYQHEPTIYSSYKMKLLPYGNNFLVWSNNLFFTINQNGDLIKSVEETSNRSVQDVVTDNGQTVVIGNGGSFLSGRRGVVSLAKLDGSLNLAENVEYSTAFVPSGPYGVGTSGFVNNGTLFTSGNIEDRIFFLSLPFGSSFPQSTSAMWFDDNGNYSSAMFNMNDGFYRINADRTTSPQSTVVQKFDFNRVMQWSKTIDKASLHSDTFYALDNALMFIPFGVSYENEVWDNKSIIKADTLLEQNDCIRVNQNNNTTLIKENLVREVGSFAFTNTPLATQSYEPLVSILENSQVTEVCAATPVSGETGDCKFTSSFRSNGPNDGNSSVCKLANNHILTVGGNGTGGVVTLLQNNSDVVWRKRLVYGERTIGLSSVQPCPDGQSAIVLGSYATGQTNRAHLIVFRINMSGTVVWSKLLHSSNTRFTTGLRKLEFSGGSQKYLITAWYNEYSSVDDMELYRLDENGNLLSSKKVAGTFDEQISGVVSTTTGFTILGSASSPGGQPVRPGIVLSFNNTLGLNWGKRLGGGDYIHTTGALPTVSPIESYIIVAHKDNSNKLILSNFNSASTSFSVKTTNMGASSDKVSPSIRLVDGDNNTFYCIVNYTTNRAAEVLKFDDQLNELWRKKLDFGSKNSISQLLNDANEELLLVGGVVGTKSSYLAKTNLELQNCISETVPATSYTQEAYTAADFTPTISDLPNTYQNISLSVSDLTAERTDHCSENCNTTSLPPSEYTVIQSPNFYLQAAGSTGADGSAQGIHTRWIFSGAIGEKHLPKGNYASNTNNFNKPDDFVYVYRAPYKKITKTINFSTAPNIVDDANGLWIYRVEGKDFHVYFRNLTQYAQVRNTINPATNAQGFMQNYGSELVEVESKRNLFFAVEAKVSSSASNSSLQTETLSVSTNTLIALKKATNRKTYASTALQDIRLLCENGRTFRCIGTNTYLTEVRLELYGDFIEDANETTAWTPMGSYALTLNDTVALQQLEPTAGLVNGNWPRFNDNARVNIDNYINK